jgi:hypothetical protein
MRARESSAELEPNESHGDICRHFLKCGRCRLGATCRHRHVGLSNRERAAEAKTNTVGSNSNDADSDGGGDGGDGAANEGGGDAEPHDTEEKSSANDAEQKRAADKLLTEYSSGGDDTTISKVQEEGLVTGAHVHFHYKGEARAGKIARFIADEGRFQVDDAINKKAYFVKPHLLEASKSEETAESTSNLKPEEDEDSELLKEHSE